MRHNTWLKLTGIISIVMQVSGIADNRILQRWAV